ncbi:MAG: potassium-transporting ATPase subunit C [Planctomycetota bacterium]
MTDLLSSLRLLLVSTLLCVLGYGGAVVGLGQLACPSQAQGTLLLDGEGHPRGAYRIAQGFSRAEYFWPRPSACGYAANAAGGSNLSPTNPALTERARGTIAQLQPGPGERVPADLVAASGSGLDPHITVPAAELQVERVARARGLTPEQVRAAFPAAEERALGVFGGETLINVLVLNLALDRAHPAPAR